MSSASINLRPIYKELKSRAPYQNIGKILSSQGMVYEATLPRAIMGCSVEFVTQNGQRCQGEVVGIDGEKCKVMPYKEITGINSQTKVYLKELTTTIKVGNGMLGRIVDFQGNPMDGKGPIEGELETRSIFGEPINPMQRPPIRQNLDTGINAINAFITAGKGQRLAVMAGSGVGKSTIMGMIARNTNADINVIALVGERGR
ncbi:MAG: EscN/YscN/HrcN family type III secretion system ATPase, partial [Bacteriovoracaceae bacterium]